MAYPGQHGHGPPAAASPIEAFLRSQGAVEGTIQTLLAWVEARGIAPSAVVAKLSEPGRWGQADALSRQGLSLDEVWARLQAPLPGPSGAGTALALEGAGLTQPLLGVPLWLWLAGGAGVALLLFRGKGK